MEAGRKKFFFKVEETPSNLLQTSNPHAQIPNPQSPIPTYSPIPISPYSQFNLFLKKKKKKKKEKEKENIMKKEKKNWRKIRKKKKKN